MFQEHFPRIIELWHRVLTGGDVQTGFRETYNWLSLTKLG